ISESVSLSGNGSIRELALFFLRLGTTAFGGPAAHIALMEDELVRRRRWLSREKFLDLLGASNLIPGRVQANWRYILATYAPDG
ncbi:MAG: chromate transporter, partial [Acidobacteriaceae bacterium]|nr:chromate transporter [Acidobacteriaceae bacterium]